MEPPKTFSSEVGRHWDEIMNKNYVWDRYVVVVVVAVVVDEEEEGG